MPKVGKPPSDAQRSGNRERAAWEREVFEQIGDTTLSLGEAENFLFLFSEKLNKAQQIKDELENLIREIRLSSDNRPNELERRIEQIERVPVQVDRYEELNRRIDELEKLIWQSPLSN